MVSGDRHETYPSLVPLPFGTNTTMGKTEAFGSDSYYHR